MSHCIDKYGVLPSLHFAGTIVLPCFSPIRVRCADIAIVCYLLFSTDLAFKTAKGTLNNWIKFFISKGEEAIQDYLSPCPAISASVLHLQATVFLQISYDLSPLKTLFAIFPNSFKTSFVFRYAPGLGTRSIAFEQVWSAWIIFVTTLKGLRSSPSELYSFFQKILRLLS